MLDIVDEQQVLEIELVLCRVLLFKESRCKVKDVMELI